MLALTALLSLAAFVSADQTFSLVGRGENFEYNVEIADGVLGFNNGGEIGSFLLHEPSGYLAAQGKEVIVGTDNLYLSSDDHSKDFGIEDGKLRFNVQGTGFYACPKGTAYEVSTTQCDSGVSIELYTAGAAADPSSVPASSAAPSSEAPATSEAPAANATVVHSHSTLVTITSCAEGVECTPVVSSFEAGAAQAGFAAGAVALAGAMLL